MQICLPWEKIQLYNEIGKLPLPILMISVDYGLAEIYSRCTICFKHFILRAVKWSTPSFDASRRSGSQSGWRMCYIIHTDFVIQCLECGRNGAKKLNCPPCPSSITLPPHPPVPLGTDSGLLVLFAFYVSLALSFTSKYYLLVKICFLHQWSVSVFLKNFNLLFLISVESP